MPTFRDTKARLSDKMEQQNFVKEPWMSNLGYICVKDMHCTKKYECINYYLWLTDIHGKAKSTYQSHNDPQQIHPDSYMCNCWCHLHMIHCFCIRDLYSSRCLKVNTYETFINKKKRRICLKIIPLNAGKSVPRKEGNY